MMFFGTLGFAQENCANGIDDDGDGFIDSQDPDCAACYEIIYTVMEEDFEDYNCCPTDINQTNCINGWQANFETPDYFNTCDYLGGGFFTPSVPLPILSGEGAVGIGSWYETIGTCLDNALLVGESYDISFNVGFNTSDMVQSNLNVEVSLFGSSDCSYLNPFFPNLCQNTNWFEIATFNIVGIENDSWIFYSSSFIPNMSASAIALGHSCEFIDVSGTTQYHFLDDIEISGNFGTLLSQIPEISFTGNCLDGVFVETDINDGTSYQWFLNGQAIAGATSNPFQIDASQPGLYQVSVLDNIGCTLYSESLLIEVELDVLNVQATITDASCATASNGIIELSIDSPNFPYSILWNDGSTSSINENLSVGTYTVTIADDNGCFTIEEYSIIAPENTDATVSGDCIDGVFISIDAIPGATYQWYLEGILIPGAVANPFQILSEFPGIYHVEASNGTICTESNPLNVDIELEILDIGGDVVDLLCYGLPTGSINAVANDMNPPLTYVWSNGMETQEITNLDAGTYTVTVIDANGCFGVMDFIVNNSTPFINSLTVIQPDMSNPGAASINSSGGTMPYTYAWNNGFDLSTDNNLAAGSYSITVTDGNGCSEIFNFEITNEYNVFEMITNESCGDACDGSILLTIDGPDSDYSVDWDDDSMSGFNPIQLCSGTYSYTVTDSEGSPFIGATSIDAPPEIIISTVYEDTICANGINTDISLSISGGSAPYAFMWNTGSTNDTLFGVGPGLYAVEVMDLSGCSVLDTFIIDSLSLIELQFETTAAGCNGEENGAIDLTINNGIEPFAILWSNDSITEDLIDLGVGWYFITVTDSLGCMAIDSVQVNANSGIEVIETVNAVNCKDEDDGSIILEVSGGQLPYDIVWSNDEKVATIENLSEGIYGVTIVDDAGCTWSQNYEVLLNSDIDITAEIQDNECFEGEDGSIELTINNASASYQIIWGDGPTDEYRYDLSAGDYNVALIDSFGCEYLDSFIITEGEEITYQTIISEPGCNGATDGLISISPVTGAFPFSYLWSNGETVNQINDLPSNSYFLTITDINNCIKLDTFILSENSDVEVSETIVDNLCFGNNGGSINIDINGGIEPYDIMWSNNETSPLIENLSAGDYFVTIEDANGCSSTYIYPVSEPDSLYIEDIVELPLCHDDLGEINVQGIGGTQTYSFLWSTEETTQDINISPDNIYSVTITDLNQCTKSKTYNIEEITEIEIVTLSAIDPSPSNDDGVITISVAGGTPDYTITWDNGQIGLMASNLSSGIYMATVVDANGCSKTITITIALSNDPISVSGMATDNLCYGFCEGQIDLTIEGGSEPYSVSWSDGQLGLNAIALCNGEYQATVIDGLGEEIVSEMFIVGSPTDIIIEGNAYNISCIDIDDGAIAINSEGGEEPFDYNWSNTMIGDSIGNLGPGEYSVTVMDDNGCSESETYTIDDIPLIEINVVQLPIDCENPNGTIILNGENSYGYPYFLNGNPIVPNAQNEIDNLEPGTYNLSYAINEACLVNIESITIEEKQKNDFELSDVEFTVFEEEQVVISVNLLEDSLLTNFIVDWSIINSFDCTIMNENGQCIEVSISAQESEVIEIVITDLDGCETILEAKIIVKDRVSEIYFPNIFSPNGDGINDEFTITSNDDELLVTSIQIFDRWGNLVYAQSNTELQNLLSWDGELNGKKVASNVFVYVIEIVDGDGESKVIFGDLAVVY